MKRLTSLLGLLLVTAAPVTFASPAGLPAAEPDLAGILDRALPEPLPAAAAPACVDPKQVTNLSCDTWYSVNSSGSVLVDSCDTITPEELAEAEDRALNNADSAGTNLCNSLGCVHTATGTQFSFNCTCSNRILTCSVTLQIYCASGTSCVQ